MDARRAIFLKKAALLTTATFAGALAVIPYALPMLPPDVHAKLAARHLSMPLLVLMATPQSLLQLALITTAGLWAAGRVGLGTPLTEAIVTRAPVVPILRRQAVAALPAGMLAGAIILTLGFAARRLFRL